MGLLFYLWASLNSLSCVSFEVCRYLCLKLNVSVQSCADPCFLTLNVSVLFFLVKLKRFNYRWISSKFTQNLFSE